MHWNTVTILLQQVLRDVMREEIFHPFRLVGGTSLSLQIGHRESVDIDFFTDSEYGSVDFVPIHKFFNDRYSYVSTNKGLPFALGTSWYVGESEHNAVKVDIYYTEPFIRPYLEEETVRMASMEDIITMKLEILGNGGRKKDFWDLHALHENYTIQQMISLHQERYPYTHSPEELRAAFKDFDSAEDDFNPVCLLGKHWEFIKLDFIRWSEEN